jgi:hypothetical protein
LDTRFAGLNPTKVMEFKGDKNPQHIFLRGGGWGEWEVRLEAPCCKILWHVKIHLQVWTKICEISSSHGGEYDVQNCLLGYTHL